jgi:hypothetical protein
MASCEQFQAQLLGYLYDLPEAEERESLRQHLQQCAGCQAALARAERQKQLLAAAAKADFPAIRFQPPPAGEVVGSDKRTAKRIWFPQRLWLGSALAASILLLLGGGVPATIWSWRFSAAQQHAHVLTAEYQAKFAEAIRLGDDRNAALERKRQDVVQAQEAIRKLAENRQQKRDAPMQAALGRPLNMVLSGPQTIQPGTANSYEVATLNQHNQPVPSPLDVRVVDGNQVLFQGNYANNTGEQRIALPANLPVTANSNLLMEVTANQVGGRQEQIRQELELAAPVYLTHLTTDRSTYLPGETVYFRSLTLERFSLKPAQEEFQVVYTLTKPPGEEAPVLSGSTSLLDAKTHLPLLGPDKKPIQGIGAGEFVLDPGSSPGEYILTVREANNRFAPQQRRFIVGPYEAKSLAQPAPIVAKKLHIDFFPEGGELVAGVPNRVYFQSRTLLDRPAELKAHLIDQEGRVIVAAVETLRDAEEPGVNQGMGLFVFTPQTGRKYELKIDSPGGIEGNYVLPPLKEDGLALSASRGVTGPTEPIHVEICSPQRDRTLLVGAYCRGRVMDHRTVLARKNEAMSVDLLPAQEVGGVYRITVFEEPRVLAQQFARSVPADSRQQLLPIAERLVYRKPAEQLHLTLTPDRVQHLPGDKVKLSITARNEKEQPAPAVLLVGVVAKSALTTAEEASLPSMPAYYYLTTELSRPEDLEYADVLLGSHPKAAAALDLLLGTQGWRRFTEQNPGKLQQPLPEDADRLLVTIGQSSSGSVDGAQQKARPQTASETELAKLKEQEVHAGESLVAAQSDQEFASKMEALRSELGLLRVQQSAAVSQVEAQRMQLHRFRSLLLPALAVILGAIAAVLVVLAIRRALPRGLPRYALAGVCSLLVVGVVLLLREIEHDNAKPAALAGMPPLPELKAQLAVAAGGLPGAAPKAPELQMDQVARSSVEKSNDDKDSPRQPSAPPYSLANGQAEGKAGLQTPLAASPILGAKDKVQNPGLYFSYKADNRKKALSEEEQKVKSGTAMLAKNREQELLRGQQYRTLQKAELKQQLTPKQMAQQQLLANRPEAVPQTTAMGLSRGFQGGLGGAGSAAGRGNAPAAARSANLGSASSSGMNGLTDKVYGTDAAKFANQAQKPSTSAPVQPLLVREYAHLRPAGSASAGRSGLVDTLYWHPVLVLPDGKAEVFFDLCDTAATYQITAVGHTLDGRLGTVTRTLESRLP